jgi:hypothetical protein
MNQPSGSQKPSFWDFLRSLFGGSTNPNVVVTPPRPVVPPDNTTEPARIVSVRVLLVIYNPITDIPSGTRLSQKMHWNDPDNLSNEFIQDIMETSGGLARYQIVERVELTEFPALKIGRASCRERGYRAV